MGADASWALERAILDRLTAAPAVAKIFGTRRTGTPCDSSGSTDAASGEEPVRTERPRYRYGDGVARSWQSATFDGQEHDIAIEMWTDERRWPAREAAAAIIDALHNADLTLPGHALVDLQFEQSETRSGSSPGQTHCILRFRALTVRD